jgi:acetyl esterase
MGNRDSFDFVCRHLAHDSGLAVVNVDYRLAPEHPFPAALDDAWAATCWVAQQGAAHGLPSQRLTVFGESAGGNLAAVVALQARDRGGPPLLAQALVYPATDARQDSESLATFAEGFLQRAADVAHAFRTYALDHGVAPTDWRLSPLLAPSHAGLPPALVLTAECDAVRDDGEAYAARLAQEGVPATCVRYQGMLHTFYSMRGTVPAAALAQQQVSAFLRDAVAGA